MQRTDAQRRLKRSKASERDFGRWLLDHDDPDPRFRGIASTTGRVGFVTSLQYDVVSKHMVGENKQVKVPARLWKWWKQLLQIAQDENKEPVLRIEPTNVDTVPNPRLRKRPGAFHIITETRHAELLDAEKERDMLLIALVEAKERAGT